MEYFITAQPKGRKTWLRGNWSMRLARYPSPLIAGVCGGGQGWGVRLGSKGEKTGQADVKP